MKPASKPVRLVFAALLLVAGVFALYARTAQHAFVSIDVSEYLLDNQHVQHGLTWKDVGWAWTAKSASNWHPLTWMSHMLDVSLFGLSKADRSFGVGLFGFGEAGHNLVNAAWHALNAVLVFALFLRLTGYYGRSLFVAACFAFHPQHVESVAWIAERKDVLAAAFGLASLLAWERWARAGSRTGYGLSFVLLALGLCAKPMLVTWPFVLLLLDAWPFERAGRARGGWGRLVVEKLPFFGLSAASAALTWWAQSSGGAVQSLELIPLEWRLLNVVRSYGLYLWHTVWPVDLIVHYPHPGPTIALRDVALAAIVVGGIGFVAFLQRKRAPWLLVGWCFYLGTLVPVIGLVQVGGQALADRYSYLPLLGVFLVVAYAAAELAARAPLAKRLLAPVAVLLVLAQFAVAWEQVGKWKDSFTLGSEVVRVEPQSSWGWNLIGRQQLEAGLFDYAAQNLARSVEVQPGDPNAWHMYGKALFNTGELPGAENAFRRALALTPENPAYLTHLGEAVLTQGRVQESEPYLRRAIELDPSYPGARSNFGRWLLSTGDFDGAEREFRAAIELKPGFTPARNQLARLLMRRGDHAGALREIEIVLGVSPNEADLHRGRARCLMALGREAEAASELEAVVKQFPAWLPGQGDLVWLLASASDPRLRDVPRAVQVGERALATAQGERPPGLLDALALSYAQAGRFADAVAAAKAAGRRAEELGDPGQAERIAKRVAAYEAQRVDLSVPR
ncbi:MAG: tetratricopeptide repeat protein [Planctomycetes bacterium]|nr:tetratricopeptide repeat protein [Planctomycetota bacterium]